MEYSSPLEPKTNNSTKYDEPGHDDTLFLLPKSIVMEEGWKRYDLARASREGGSQLPSRPEAKEHCFRAHGRDFLEESR